MTISIEIVHGQASVQDDDRERAIAAAQHVFDQAGQAARACQQEYRIQWLALDQEDGMTGLARVWIDARDAAALALTEGWSKPEGADCTIACS